MKKQLVLFVAILTLVLISNGFAMDIGSMHPTDTQFSMEIIHENYERDIRLTYPTSHRHATAMQEEQRSFIRFNYSPQPNWGLSFDAGATDAEESEGYAPLLGLGAHVVVYQHNGFYATIFAKATYTFDIEYRGTFSYEVDGGTETDTEKQTEELWEYGGGLQLSKEWIPCSGGRIIGYGGVMASFIDSSEDIRGDYVFNDETGVETGTYSNHDFKIEEEHPVTYYAGVEATLTKYEIGLRAESRFYDRTSFSVGLFKNF